MSARQPVPVLETSEVVNQPPPLPSHNLFTSDPVLTAAVTREGAGWAAGRLQAFGAAIGTENAAALGEAANRYPPELKAFDRFGRRIDEVVYHPAYHELMRLAKTHAVHSIAWTAPEPGGHVAHMALEYLLVQVEAGVCCPITMTYAGYAALRNHPATAAWLPGIAAASYDWRFIPAPEKSGLTIGMAMTEKQGGSDVRSNMTRASATGESGWFALDGHKWFCSAPMSDAFLTLAQSEAGLSCFLVPRWRPDGTRNPFHIQRLKDKLGDRSNASAEIEYRGTSGQLVGEVGQGVRTIIEMVHHTRLDTALAAAGMMRAGVVQAVHHASHRSVFQKRLIDQPLMRNVLADLVIEWVAATLLVARVARSFDAAATDRSAALFSRLGVAIAKYWTNKRLPAHACEALECIGGSGYVEESAMPRLYRQAPVNGIWEGSGNVICLDILRTIERQPESLETLFAELSLARGGDRRFDLAVERLKDSLRDAADLQTRARRLAGSLAVALQASLLLRFAPAAVAEAFCNSRLASDWSGIYGTLPAGSDAAAIIELGRLPG
jgi:putative acyl-CoA dehydrogenase